MFYEQQTLYALWFWPLGTRVPLLEWFIEFGDIVQSLVNMGVYGVCSLILTLPHNNQI